MNTFTKIHIRSRARLKKRYTVFLDTDTAEQYKTKSLRYTKSRGVYYSAGKVKYQVAREILNLTQPWQHVRFASNNKLDLRRKNLKTYVVPLSHRGHYGVQIGKCSLN